MTDKRWSVATTKLIISEYERHNFLYDVRNINYRNRNKRLETYKKIASALQQDGHQYTIEDVKKKINGLTSQFLAEKMKISNSIKSVADDIYKPTVYWYNMLHFLETSMTPDESSSNLDEPICAQHTEQTTEEVSEPNEDLNCTERDKTLTIRIIGEKQHNQTNKRKLPQASEAVTDMTEIVKNYQVQKINHYQPTDPMDTFAKFVADELRSIRDASSDAVVRQAKRKIQQVIMQTWDIIDGLPPSSSPNSSSSRGLIATCQRREEQTSMVNAIRKSAQSDIIHHTVPGHQILPTDENMLEDLEATPNSDVFDS